MSRSKKNNDVFVRQNSSAAENKFFVNIMFGACNKWGEFSLFKENSAHLKVLKWQQRRKSEGMKFKNTERPWKDGNMPASHYIIKSVCL